MVFGGLKLIDFFNHVDQECLLKVTFNVSVQNTNYDVQIKLYVYNQNDLEMKAQ